ncbi:MAG TPA: alanine racemase, partial [Thermomicrobiales bacterium]|nr:alanine racemase [Thermomicrobiales bacterium]
RSVAHRQYGAAIGQPVESLTTPALLLDLPAARRNIRRMADAIARMPAELRPHVKTHKSPDLARLQAEAGARGFSTATVWEAVVLAEAGLDDLFVVNTVEGPAKIRRLAELARERRVHVAVDDLGNAGRLSKAAMRAGATLGVLIEIDTGMRRCGLDEPELAAELARRLTDLPGLRFEGVTGYEGHCSLEDDVARRALMQRAAMDILLAAVAAIEAAGVPCPIVSAGGTRTWRLTATTPGVTEIQAGTYVLMDQFHSGVEGGFEPALRVLATVISRQKGRVVVDVGSKSVADPDLTAICGVDAANLGFDEEHGRFADADLGRLSPGDVVQLLPGYAPSTVNMYDAYHVIEDGVVVDVWPIVPRGPGHHGLA